MPDEVATRDRPRAKLVVLSDNSGLSEFQRNLFDRQNLCMKEGGVLGADVSAFFTDQDFERLYRCSPNAEPLTNRLGVKERSADPSGERG